MQQGEKEENKVANTVFTLSCGCSLKYVSYVNTEKHVVSVRTQLLSGREAAISASLVGSKEVGIGSIG